MLRKGLALGFLVLFTLPCFAQEQTGESITITTYYPSPYGSYNELRTNKMVIGDVSAATTDAPSQGAITFAPVDEPTDYSEGTLYYDSSASNFKYFDGSAWQAFGGSGMSYTKYCFTNASDGAPLCGTVVLGTQWLCDAGFTVQKALGSWGLCDDVSVSPPITYYFLPPGGSCGPSPRQATVMGNAYVCSQ